MTSSPPTPSRLRLATAARALAGTGILGAGVLAAGAFTNAAPAAPQDCLPVVGCVTTVVPTVSVPGVTLPTLPTLPGTTTTTPGVATTGSTAAGTSASTTSATTTNPAGEATVSEAVTAFRPKASVRVRGRGARRVVEIRVNLTKPARLNALLSRKRASLARRLFTAKAGPHLFRLRIGRAAKPGLANLALVYRAATGQSARTTHRLRLPR